jgi:Uma2 family endonuclease
MTIAAPSHPESPQHILLDRISWQFYERLLEELNDRPIQVTFDNGSLEIMAPLPPHEFWKKRVAMLVECMLIELEVDFLPLGSTTFKREDLEKGFEPEECYYIQKAAAVRGKDRLDLTIDPPPDLAVEVDITSWSIARQPIYAALGIPELWRFENRRLIVLHLDRAGQYARATASLAFPFLPLAEFEKFLLRLEHESPTKVLREFRDWVKTLPR